jgi:hypothetical protein
MKLAAVDAPPITVSEARLVDFEQCLLDALKDTQRAPLEFEARLATALAAEERIEREHERAQADKLAEEVAEIARKFADEAAKVARKSERVPPLRRPLPSVRRGETVRRSWWPFRRAG